MVTNPNANEARGELLTEPNSDGSVLDGFFVPLVPRRDMPEQIRIFSLSKVSDDFGELQIYPIRTNRNIHGYLEQKYSNISTLSLTVDTNIDPFSTSALEIQHELLAELPRGFASDYNYGLGFPRQFDRLITLIEENTDCREISFVDGYDVQVDEEDPKILRFGLGRFEQIRAELSKIYDRGSRATTRVSNTYVHNAMASAFSLKPAELSLGRLSDSRFVAKAAANINELSEQERDQLIEVVVTESAILAENRPESFQKLHQEVELVNLERLIGSFEAALKKRWSERDWQNFFKGNEFALQMVFGAPVVIVQSEASVGGTRIDGKGGKIADYLMRNTLSNNLALVEIKKPSTPLLYKKRNYRAGVYAPSWDLDGAITQVLDQAHKLVIDLPMMAYHSRRTDLEAYSVSCVVIAGRSPAPEEPDHQKSFELYRGNSRNVKIVTYDEVLEQLKILRDFLRTGKSEAEAVASHHHQRVAVAQV